MSDFDGVAADRRGSRTAADEQRPEHEETEPDLDAPSINDVIESHQSPGRATFHIFRRKFESDHGKIREEYFARRIHAGAVLIEKRKWWRRGQHRIVLAYESRVACPELDEMIREIRTEERQAAILLAGPAHEILVQTIFALVVFLLNVLDSVHDQDVDESSAQANIKTAVESARKELRSIDEFSDVAARRSALLLYLLGLPVGALSGALLVFGAFRSVTVDSLTDNRMLGICLASGAIGAVISVMARINSGKRLEVDAEQGRVVTVLAGSFRPVIGAVFGAALYVLVVGGLLPLATPATATAPTPAETEQITLFFAGLAFLAGFSERWAQDTIVNSAPKGSNGTWSRQERGIGDR